MYVFVVLSSIITPSGFNIEVEGVYEHLAHAMPYARALREGQSKSVKIVRQTLVQSGPTAAPDFSVAVGGTPGQGVTIPMKIGPAEPAFRHTITTPESERAIARRMIERAEQDAAEGRRKAQGQADAKGS